ncbi:MAG: pitrilysin family protein [Gemmatimonadales bacterium]
MTSHAPIAHRLSVAIILALALAPPLSAQTSLTRPPAPGVPADLRLPAVQLAKLPNGVTLRLVEMHEVPLVQVSLRITGGARLDGDQSGLATFTANMLDEGAGDRDAVAIAAQAAYLGADLFTAADWDHIYLDLNTPKRTLAGGLDLLADLALRPAFHAADVARERDLRLSAIIQQQDEPGETATLAFNAITFPLGHPYHRPADGDSSSTTRLDSVAVRRFYQQLFKPDQAEFIITGDLTLAEATAEIGKRFGRWIPDRMARLKPPIVPIAQSPNRRMVYLVDKPGAAQSVIMIGAPGVARANPDYAAIEVMNTILGGSFSSRLNQNLRETRGYTYGAGTSFAWRPLPGPFLAGSSVRTDVTDSSLVEFFKELNAIRDAPVSDVELTRARNYITLALPGQFETTRQMAGQIGELLDFGLPTTWYTGYLRQVRAVTAADVQRVARRYIDPQRMRVVVVGDIEKIRPGIEALGLGPISVRGPDGNAPTP